MAVVNAQTFIIQKSIFIGESEEETWPAETSPDNFFFNLFQTSNISFHACMRPSSHVLRLITVFPFLVLKLTSALAIQSNMIPRQLDDFALLSSELQTPATGVVRKHYVAIEHIVWDYSPNQWDYYHNASLFDSPAKLWTHHSKL
jgi:hypothetical protein